MKLLINDVEQELIPIKDFRNRHQLPDTFSVAQFEPKNYDGLGRLDKAGSQMNELRDHILQLIPNTLPIQELMGFIDRLQLQFQSDLFNINDAIALKDVEVEFAVAGFGDVLRTMIYQMIPARASKSQLPSFDSIYFNWLNDSVRVSKQIHEMEHQDNIWQIQVINQVYGRAGLQIKIGDDIVYVADGIYLCPAEGFMYSLLKDVSNQIWSAIM